MDYLNDVHIITGGVVRKPVLRSFDDGSRVLNFTVAVNKGYMREKEWVERSKYYSASAWNNKADMLNSRNLGVGDLITLSGSVEADAYPSKKNPGGIVKNVVFIVEEYSLLRRGAKKETPEEVAAAAAEEETLASERDGTESESEEEAEARAIREYNMQVENNVFDIDN